MDANHPETRVWLDKKLGNLDPHRVTRYVEDLGAIRERAQIVRDELANMLTDRLNKNMMRSSRLLTESRRSTS